MTNKDEGIKKAELIVQTAALLNTADSILEHYGIKGMRWGTRRANKKMAKLIDKKTARQLKGLNEEQIRAVITRMQLDKQYKDLKKANRSEGKAFALDVGQSVLKGALVSAAGVVGKEMGNKFIGSGKKAVAEEAAKKTLEETLTEQSMNNALKSVQKIKNKHGKDSINPFAHLPPPPSGGLSPRLSLSPPPSPRGFSPTGFPVGPFSQPPAPRGFSPEGVPIGPFGQQASGFKTEKGRTFLDTTGVLIKPVPKKKS